MIEIDPGHRYALDTLDADFAIVLDFVKRIGDKYPGNTGEPRPGTNCQEVTRALIARVNYLDHQDPDPANDLIRFGYRIALYGFEERAARRHGRIWETVPLAIIESLPVCSLCGHIQCSATHRGTA